MDFGKSSFANHGRTKKPLEADDRKSTFLDPMEQQDTSVDTTSKRFNRSDTAIEMPVEKKHVPLLHTTDRDTNSQGQGQGKFDLEQNLMEHKQDAFEGNLDINNESVHNQLLLFTDNKTNSDQLELSPDARPEIHLPRVGNECSEILCLDAKDGFDKTLNGSMDHACSFNLVQNKTKDKVFEVDGLESEKLDLGKDNDNNQTEAADTYSNLSNGKVHIEDILQNTYLEITEGNKEESSEQKERIRSKAGGKKDEIIEKSSISKDNEDYVVIGTTCEETGKRNTEETFIEKTPIKENSTKVLHHPEAIVKEELEMPGTTPLDIDKIDETSATVEQIVAQHVQPAFKRVEDHFQEATLDPSQETKAGKCYFIT